MGEGREGMGTYGSAFVVHADSVGVKVSESEAGKGEESNGLDEDGRHVDGGVLRLVKV